MVYQGFIYTFLSLQIPILLVMYHISSNTMSNKRKHAAFNNATPKAAKKDVAGGMSFRKASEKHGLN